ncbi:MAG: hypothetical protein COU69_03100 [Candidatus Pacebacteria bacterium CG10_big_fil_rev_8_21_14_0_10_56_10]|nr:MAG: hypothetical protein COU69_03100 [Candidatus Pacebacteria bacterium CG10_big_fil_rev_8_21_14_0_10_56_10]
MIRLSLLLPSSPPISPLRPVRSGSKLAGKTEWSGFITTTTVLVVMGVLLIVGTSSALLSIDIGLLQLASEQVERTDSSLDSCIENALLELNLLKTIPTVQTLPNGASCAADIVDQSQTSDELTVTFTLVATDSAYTAAAEVTAVRSDAVTITSWKEITPP